MGGTPVRPDTTPDQLLHMVFSSGRPFILMQVSMTVTQVDRQHVLMALCIGSLSFHPSRMFPPWPVATASQSRARMPA